MKDRYGQPLWVMGHRLTAVETVGDYAFADVRVTANVPGPPPHFHAETDELFYVLEGPVELMRGDRWHSVEAGESFLVPKGTLHSFRNSSDDTKRFITIHTPGTGADTLFLTFGIPASEEGSFERSLSNETVQAFIAAAKDNDMYNQISE